MEDLKITSIPDFELAPEHSKNDRPPKMVVRIKDNVYVDSKGSYHNDRTMTVLKRKSHGYHCFESDCEDSGIKDAMDLIRNYLDVKEGMYELKFSGSTDFETGYMDDWEYWLKPYLEEETTQETLS